MKIGHYNRNNYLHLCNESINIDKLEDKAGIVIPEENKKAFDWLKKEYDKGKLEAECEYKIGSSDFSPGYDLQTNLKSVKEFKPGLFGAKTTPTVTDGTLSDFKPTVYKEKTKSDFSTMFSKKNDDTSDENKEDDFKSRNNDEESDKEEKSEKTEFKFDLRKK